MVKFGGGFGARLLVAGLALFLCTGVASADAITGGDLFGVFTNNASGEFSPLGGGSILSVSEEEVSFETYTIVHFVQFAPTPPSEFPGMLVPMAFPAAFFPAEFGFVANTQFFFIGSVGGLGEDPDHLLLSNSNDGQTPSSAIGEPLHETLVSGAMALAGGDPIRTMSAVDFWELFDDVNPAGIAETFFTMPQFGPDGPVSQLSDYAFEGGSEDLFGFDPPYRLGLLSGSPDSYTFTDAAGNTYNPIPEPSTLALMAGALVLGFGIRRRRNRRAA